MATAKQLKALRKKFGLGEFKKKKKRKSAPCRKTRACKGKFKTPYSRRRGNSGGRRKRTGSPPRFVGTMPASVGFGLALLPQMAPGAIDSRPPIYQGQLGYSASPGGIPAPPTPPPPTNALGGDSLIRTISGEQLVGVFQRPDGSQYKAYI